MSNHDVTQAGSGTFRGAISGTGGLTVGAAD